MIAPVSSRARCAGSPAHPCDAAADRHLSGDQHRAAYQHPATQSAVTETPRDRASFLLQRQQVNPPAEPEQQRGRGAGILAAPSADFMPTGGGEAAEQPEDDIRQRLFRYRPDTASGFTVAAKPLEDNSLRGSAPACFSAPLQRGN